MKYDTLIRNALIIDGSNTPGYPADAPELGAIGGSLKVLLEHCSAIHNDPGHVLAPLSSARVLVYRCAPLPLRPKNNKPR